MRTIPDPTFSKLTQSAMISSPTVTVEETDGCSSNVGRTRLPEDFRGMRGPDPELCGTVRARRERSPILCAGGHRNSSLKACSCANLWATQFGRAPLELSYLVTVLADTTLWYSAKIVPLSEPMRTVPRRSGPARRCAMVPSICSIDR